MPLDFARNHDTPPLIAVGMVDQQIRRGRRRRRAHLVLCVLVEIGAGMILVFAIAALFLP